MSRRRPTCWSIGPPSSGQRRVNEGSRRAFFSTPAINTFRLQFSAGRFLHDIFRISAQLTWYINNNFLPLSRLHNLKPPPTTPMPNAILNEVYDCHRRSKVRHPAWITCDTPRSSFGAQLTFKRTFIITVCFFFLINGTT